MSISTIIVLAVVVIGLFGGMLIFRNSHLPRNQRFKVAMSMVVLVGSLLVSAVSHSMPLSVGTWIVMGLSALGVLIWSRPQSRKNDK